MGDQWYTGTANSGSFRGVKKKYYNIAAKRWIIYITLNNKHWVHAN